MQGAEAAAKARTTVGRRLPGSSARYRGGDEGCCCGWRTPPPHSPYRTRGPDCALALRPVGCSPQFPEVARRASPQPGGEGRGGSARAAAGGREGAGSRPGRAAAAPLAPQSHTPGSPHASAAPSLPGHLFGAAHRRLLHRARRPPPPSAPSRPREASAHTARPRRRRPAHTARPRRRPLPRASPPSPRLHAPPQLSRARAAAALMDPAGCAAPQASAGGDDDRYPNGQSHCHPRDSPAAVVASARTHAQSTLSPLPPFLPSLPFSLASPLTTPSTASQSYRLTPRMRKPLPSSAAFRPYACALTAHPENRINTSARSRQSLTAANPP